MFPYYEYIKLYIFLSVVYSSTTKEPNELERRDNDTEHGSRDEGGVDDETVRDHTGCPRSFLTRCECGYRIYMKQRKFIVNCTNSHFLSTHPLENLPDETEVLIFVGNFLGVLPTSAFGMKKYFSRLETADFSRNHIKEIQENAFVRVSEIQTLILDHNDLYITDTKLHPKVFQHLIKLESLHLTNAFTGLLSSQWSMSSLQIIFQSSHLYNLKKLHLELNNIRELRDPFTFCSLTSLEHLYLSRNRLYEIDFRLTCLPRLTFIDLSFNNIQSLSTNSTFQLDSMSSRREYFSVDLTGNPFACDCHMNEFLQWIRSNNETLRSVGNYTCFNIYTGDGKKQLLSEIELPHCPVDARNDEDDTDQFNTTGAIMTTCAIISFCCSLLLAVLIIRCRKMASLNQLEAVPRRIHDKILYIKQSRQYSSVEPDCEAVEVHV